MKIGRFILDLYQKKKFDVKNKRFIHDIRMLTVTNIKKQIDENDIISFDIFDTLIVRKVKDDDLINILDKELKEKGLLKNFALIRKNSEEEVKKTIGINYTLDDVYDEFRRESKLPQETIHKVKEKEIENYIYTCIRRDDMAELFEYSKQKGKTIIIVTDMYLTRDVIESVLEKSGYSGYERLFISNEEKARKDRGDLWDIVINKYKGRKILHIGDNVVSDVKNVNLKGGRSIRLYSSEDLFFHNRYMKFSQNGGLIGDKVVESLIISRLCSSPFTLNNEIIKVNDLKKFSYIFIAPCILYFCLWLKERICEDNIEEVWFLSREGYYLQNYYNEICGENQKTLYFYTSRRAASVPCLENKEEIEFTFQTAAYGKFKDILWNRYGIVANTDIDDFYIRIPKESDKFKKLMEPYYTEIIANSQTEKKRYLDYINQISGNYMGRNIAVVDLGYSGTVQYYLSKLTGKKYSGYYFALVQNPKPNKIKSKAVACYEKGKDDIFWTLMECCLTAPHGQVEKFKKDDDGSFAPVFCDTMTPGKEKILSTINDGVLEFFSDCKYLLGNTLSTGLFSRDFMQKPIHLKNSLYHWGDNIKCSLSIDCLYDGSTEENFVLGRK